MPASRAPRCTKTTEDGARGLRLREGTCFRGRARREGTLPSAAQGDWAHGRSAGGRRQYRSAAHLSPSNWSPGECRRHAGRGANEHLASGSFASTPSAEPGNGCESAIPRVDLPTVSWFAAELYSICFSDFTSMWIRVARIVVPAVVSSPGT